MRLFPDPFRSLGVWLGMFAICAGLAGAAAPEAASPKVAPPDISIRIASLQATLACGVEIYDLMLPGMGETFPRLAAQRVGALPDNTRFRGLVPDRPIFFHARLASPGTKATGGFFLPLGDLAVFRAGFKADSALRRNLGLDQFGSWAVLYSTDEGNQGSFAAWAAIPDPGGPELCRMRVSGNYDRHLLFPARLRLWSSQTKSQAASPPPRRRRPRPGPSSPGGGGSET